MILKIPKFLALLILPILLTALFLNEVGAQAQSTQLPPSSAFISLVMPVRGNEFWPDPKMTPDESFNLYYQEIAKRNLRTTWLLRYDALKDQKIVNQLKNVSNSEVGLFLEVIPSVAEAAHITYNKSDNWHVAGTILITGYKVEDRIKLIDEYFKIFKEKFGYYPKSVGAWWIDGQSLEYMNKKYQVSANLAVADQFSTDSYQIWGLHWSTPYYPSKINASQPAQSITSKTGTVTFQWAGRDPYRGYGSRVEQSTLSVQANDYLLHKGLNINYFNYLLDVFVKDNVKPFGQLTIGIENDFTQKEYRDEFVKQLDEIKKRPEVVILTMSEFSEWYKRAFPDQSPTKIIFAKDYEDPSLNVTWYQSPIYRAGVFQTKEGLYLKDLRTYSDTMKEPCLEVACEELNLAKTVSKALDYVTFGQQLTLEEGPSKDFIIDREGFKVNYTNDLEINKELVFLKNDLIIDKRTNTIPGLIIETTSNEKNGILVDGSRENTLPRIDLLYSMLSTLVFTLVVIFLIFLPGRVVSRKFDLNFYEDLVISSVIGIFLLTTLSLVFGFLNQSYIPFFVLGVLSLLSLRVPFKFPRFNKSSILPLSIFLIGVVISIMPVFNSGLLYEYGYGFWGANGHDAIWHLSLIESLRFSVPAENFALAGEKVTNYHYFFDLILAKLSLIPYLDPLGMYFRLWPLLVSLLLGGAVWILGKKLNLNPISNAVLLFMTFFAGSWGWIITLINMNEISGESLFWATQSISLHLNPPYALSLVVLLSVLVLMTDKAPSLFKLVMISLLVSFLWGVKAYAGLLLVIALLLYSVIHFIKTKDKSFLIVSFLSVIFSAVIFFTLTTKSNALFQFNPLWLIESMIGANDRLGIQSLATLRDVYISQDQTIRVYVVNIVLVSIFILGNLGARAIATPLALKSLFTNSLLQLLSLIIISGFAISLLFVQKGNNWNVIQFVYYSLFISGIFTTLTFQRAQEIIKNSLVRRAVLGSILITIALGSLTTYGTLKNFYAKAAHSAISYEEISALDELKRQEKGIVLTVPFTIKEGMQFSNPVPLRYYVTSSYVSAFTQKPVFISDEVNLEIMNANYKRRLYAAKEYFKEPSSSWSKQFLKSNNIRYVYVHKGQEFNGGEVGLENILENNEVRIFRVN